MSVACCVLPIASFSQSPSIQTTADRNDILIGEQVKVKVKVFIQPQMVRPDNWLAIPDSIPHFEMVEKSKLDTIVYKDDSKALEQTITFTSFDSGKWTIPAFHVNLNPQHTDTAIQLITDPIPVNVSYAPPDSTNQLRDIKPIIKVSITDYTWYYIGGGILLLLLIGFFTWRYLRKRKKSPPLQEGQKLSAYEEAMLVLEKLNRAVLQTNVEIKDYHTCLSDIFKRYLGRKQNKNLANRTTGDLLINMAENNFSQQDISTLAMTLRCNDAVKFAKYIPAAMGSSECLVKIKETINLIEQQTTNPKL